MEQYTDKEVLGDGLSSQKATTALFNTAANECMHKDLRNTVMKILEEEHQIQSKVFEMMHAKGYYPTPDAEEKKIKEAEQKFAQCCKCK